MGSGRAFLNGSPRSSSSSSSTKAEIWREEMLDNCLLGGCLSPCDVNSDSLVLVDFGGVDCTSTDDRDWRG